MSKAKEVVSKELLSEVLGTCHVESVHDILVKDKLQFAYYTDDIGGIDVDSINIYDLAHKCKEWGLSEFKDCLFSINEFSTFDSNRIEVVKYTDSNTEEKRFNFKDLKPENMIESCQWILENKGSN